MALRKAKRVKFNDAGNPFASQQALWAHGNKIDPWPRCVYSPDELLALSDRIPENGLVGYDLEGSFSPLQTVQRPTVLGIAVGDEAASIRWDVNICREVVDIATKRGAKLVAYSTSGADKLGTDYCLGVDTPLDLWDDGMLSHYLVHPDFTKLEAKKEDDDDSGSLGLMNLWAASHMALDVPRWKGCRGRGCEGPCPIHNLFFYNAVDSWAGLKVHEKALRRMAEFEIPYQLYRELVELSELCMKMQQRGVDVDLEFVKNLEAEFKKKKDELFPKAPKKLAKKKRRGENNQELFGEVAPADSKKYAEFNPGSPKAGLAWFTERGLTLKSADVKDLTKKLEPIARRQGVELDELLADDLADVEQVLLRWWQFKKAGKGLSSWFNDKYVHVDGRIHPRFNSTGTCTGRLSSSGPNFTNVPARGFGALVRKAIVAPPGFVLAKNDASQLELRKVLHSAGVKEPLSGDAFTDLVVATGEEFYRAAKESSPETYEANPKKAARQVAKSVSHAYDYGEGFSALTEAELKTVRIRNEITQGARLVIPDWIYCGRVVTFTGANLAERLFGDRSNVNRARALKIQEAYTKAFPQVRQWQRLVGSQIEQEGCVTTATGRWLPLYGTYEENFKAGLAMVGQGEGADHMTALMLQVWRELTLVPVLMVHDELVYAFRNETYGEDIRLLRRVLEGETWRLPGFSVPFKTFSGKVWLEDEMEKWTDQ